MGSDGCTGTLSKGCTVVIEVAEANDLFLAHWEHVMVTGSSLCIDEWEVG